MTKQGYNDVLKNKIELGDVEWESGATWRGEDSTCLDYMGLPVRFAAANKIQIQCL